MKILFILFDYSPFGGATARIVKGLVHNFRQSGIEADILTTKYDISQPFTSKEEFGTVYRVRNYQRLNFRQLSCGIIRKGIVAFEKMRNRIYLKPKKRFVSRFATNDFINGLKRLDLKSYQYIIPVCADYAAYVAVQKYRDKYGLDCKIIVYQVDPLIENGVYTAQSFSGRLDLETCMAKETAVITTSLLKKQKEKNEIDVSNVLCLEFPSIVEQSIVKKLQADEIKVVFAGFFYKGIRDPEYALKLFSKIKNPQIKLYIIGGGLEELICHYATESNGRIVHKGVLTLDETQREIGEADILLNIGNNDIHFVPSKIFDYISTGKPIVNTYKDTACPTLPYFAKYGNSICVNENNDVEKEAEKVEKFIETNLHKTLSYTTIKENFYENTLEFVAERLIDFFKKGAKN